MSFAWFSRFSSWSSGQAMMRNRGFFISMRRMAMDAAVDRNVVSKAAVDVGAGTVGEVAEFHGVGAW